MGPFHAFGLEFRHGHDLIDQPHVECFGGVILPTQIPNFSRLLLADHSRQVARPKSAVEAAHLRTHLAEDRVVRREAQIAHDVQHVTAPDRVTRHQRDHDLGHRADELLQIQHIQPRHPIVTNVTGVPADALIAARAKRVLPIRMRSGSGEQHDANGRVFARVAEGSEHLRDRLRPKRIALLRSVNRHLGDAASFVVKDVGVSLRNFPIGSHGRAAWSFQANCPPARAVSSLAS